MLFKNINVDGLNIFYREAGSEGAPPPTTPNFSLWAVIGRRDRSYDGSLTFFEIIEDRQRVSARRQAQRNRSRRKCGTSIDARATGCRRTAGGSGNEHVSGRRVRRIWDAVWCTHVELTGSA